MADLIFVRPVPGGLVRDPAQGFAPLHHLGEWVPRSFWAHTRLEHKDLELVESKSEIDRAEAAKAAGVAPQVPAPSAKERKAQIAAALAPKPKDEPPAAPAPAEPATDTPSGDAPAHP